MNNNTDKKILPPGWKWVKLGEYVISVKGKKPKRVSKEKTLEYSIPYVNIKAFEKKEIDEYTDGIGCVLCDVGDFLMVWDGSRSGFVGKGIKGALGSTLVKLNFPDIENNYAFYFLQSKFIEINTRAKGVGIPHVDPNILWNYRLLIPPLETQRTIVSKIEQLFSELDKGVESLKIAQQQLKTYRQSVLKWAFEGKLTKDEGRGTRDEGRRKKEEERWAKDKLPMAAEPQEDYLTDLPEGWKWVKLGEIALEITDGDHQPPPKTSSGVPFITISNIDKHTNKIDFSKTFSVSSTYYGNLKKNRKPRIGDILYTVTGSFGIPILIDFEKEFCFQRHVGLIRPLTSVNQRWLYYLLQSQLIYNQAKKTATGTAQKTVALNSLRNFNIPMCPYEEQQTITMAIETRLSVADKMEESIIQSLQQAEALRQSILKGAFEGALI
jgi:type I restriction enzyme S subunit